MLTTAKESAMLKTALLKFFVEEILPYLLAVLGAGLAALTAQAFQALREWRKGKKGEGVMNLAATYAEKLVLAAEGTTVARLKAAAENGSLTAEGGKQVKDEVMGDLKKLLGTSGLQELATHLGGSDDGKPLVENFLSTLVEGAAHEVSSAPQSVVVNLPAVPITAEQLLNLPLPGRA